MLIDGQQLASLMIEHNAGVTPQTSYVLKRLDADDFTEVIRARLRIRSDSRQFHQVRVGYGRRLWHGPEFGL